MTDEIHYWRAGNVIMAVVLATFVWGINAVIVIGLTASALYMCGLVEIFIQAGYGVSIAGILRQSAVSFISKVISSLLPLR